MNSAHATLFTASTLHTPTDSEISWLRRNESARPWCNRLSSRWRGRLGTLLWPHHPQVSRTSWDILTVVGVRQNVARDTLGSHLTY